MAAPNAKRSLKARAFTSELVWLAITGPFPVAAEAFWERLEFAVPFISPVIADATSLTDRKGGEVELAVVGEAPETVVPV
jgi:hypothetical protein